MDYAARYTQLVENLNFRRGQQALLVEERAQLERQLQTWVAQQATLQDEARLLQLSATAAQTSVKGAIETLVTQGLRDIFDDRTFRFSVSLYEERKTAVADFNLEERIQGQWRARDFRRLGGGLVDVVSVLLRLAGLILRRPPQRRLLLLDEPFKHLYHRYQPRAGLFLLKVAQALDVQILLVTHAEQVAHGLEGIDILEARLDEANVCHMVRRDVFQPTVEL